MEKKLLTTKEAAKYLGVSEAFLERDRWAGATIPFVRIGARAVRYEISALDAFVKSRIRLSTSDNGNIQKRRKAK
jgi:excisionase family DNA binding protein